MLKPLGDRVIVKIVEAEEKTAGGIVLPDTAKEKPTKGVVVAVGPGRVLDNGKLSTMEVAEGDTVLFSKYGGTEVKVDGQDFTILRQDDVLGILK